MVTNHARVFSIYLNERKGELPKNYHKTSIPHSNLLEKLQPLINNDFTLAKVQINKTVKILNMVTNNSIVFSLCPNEEKRTILPENHHKI